jgi:hypothetical protein
LLFSSGCCSKTEVFEQLYSKAVVPAALRSMNRLMPVMFNDTYAYEELE